MTKCPVCDRPVSQPTTGRPRKYCSQACKSRAQRRREAGAATVTVPGTKPHPRISTARLDDIINGPLPDLEDCLRLVVRRLTAVMDDPATSPRDLAAVARQLIDAASKLDQVKPAADDILFDPAHDALDVSGDGSQIV